MRFRTIPATCLLATAVAAACSDAPTHVPPPGAVDLAAPWTRTIPEAVGLDGARLFVAGEVAARIEGMRSLLVVRDGRLAFERYYGGATADSLARIGTVTESVVSALVGIALGKRLVGGLDQAIGDFDVVRELRPTDAHLGITLRQLLSMTGGFRRSGDPDRAYREWIESRDPLRHLLDRPLVSAPGTSFQHDPAAVHLLGQILEEATGRPLPAYAAEVLLDRLGAGRRAWALVGGRANGGTGLALRPRDLARFGQLHLQEGWSAHRSVVPAEWVARATAPRFLWSLPVGPLDRATYGLLWWVDLDRGAYFARDRSGQIVYVAPDAGMVVVATTDRPVDGAGRPAVEAAVLSVVVDHVLEAVRMR